MASPKHNYGNRSSQIIRELNLRIPKCWHVIDLIFAQGKEEDKKEIAKFLLGKYIPEKLDINAEVNQNTIVPPVEFQNRLTEVLKYANTN